MAMGSSGNHSDLSWPIKRHLSCFLAVVFLVISDEFALGARSKPVSNMELQRQVKSLDKSVVKTIKTADGDIVDCVDIYKQPAFDHPLLANHTIEMKPSFYPKGDEDISSTMEPLIEQLWGKRGSCPEGTIPIQRIQKSHLLMGHNRSLGTHGNNNPPPGSGILEEAGARISGGPYYGAKCKISVWNMRVETHEWSLNSIFMNNGQNYVEFGWGVNPDVFGDYNPRLYATWKRYDVERVTGCYNLRCPGFVQVDSRITLGMQIQPVSKYDGTQIDIKPSIFADVKQSKWWLKLDNVTIGYYPMSIFNDFHSAQRVVWSGGVLNTRSYQGQHTTTQMGSGHYAEEGQNRAAYFSNMLLIDSTNNAYPPQGHEIYSTVSKCYNAVAGKKQEQDPGPIFYYGGPGGPGCDA